VSTSQPGVLIKYKPSQLNLDVPVPADPRYSSDESEKLQLEGSPVVQDKALRSKSSQGMILEALTNQQSSHIWYFKSHLIVGIRTAICE
jgi:hypothetical protein